MRLAFQEDLKQCRLFVQKQNNGDSQIDKIIFIIRDKQHLYIYIYMKSWNVNQVNYYYNELVKYFKLFRTFICKIKSWFVYLITKGFCQSMIDHWLDLLTPLVLQKIYVQHYTSLVRHNTSIWGHIVLNQNLTLFTSGKVHFVSHERSFVRLVNWQRLVLTMNLLISFDKFLGFYLSKMQITCC